MKFLARNLALIGAVCLLLAEVMGETRTIFAGVPTLDDNQSKNYLQLSGYYFEKCPKVGQTKPLKIRVFLLRNGFKFYSILMIEAMI